MLKWSVGSIPRIDRLGGQYYPRACVASLCGHDDVADRLPMTWHGNDIVGWEKVVTVDR